MSYRLYSFMITTDTGSSRPATEVPVHIKNLILTMKNDTVEHKGPMLVFDLLSFLVN